MFVAILTEPHISSHPSIHVPRSKTQKRLIRDLMSLLLATHLSRLFFTSSFWLQIKDLTRISDQNMTELPTVLQKCVDPYLEYCFLKLHGHIHCKIKACCCPVQFSDAAALFALSLLDSELRVQPDVTQRTTSNFVFKFLG